MACDLTSGYTWVGCDGGPGGVQIVGFCELKNKNTITITPGTGPTGTGTVTAMALQSGKVFRKYVLCPETAFWTDAATKNPKTGAYSYAPTINVTLNTLAIATRQEILLLLQNNLMAIVTDNQGVSRLLGYNFGLQLTSADAQGGTLIQDGQKSILNLVGVDTVPALVVDPTLIATLMP